MAFIVIYDADALYPNTQRDLLIRMCWANWRGLGWWDLRPSYARVDVPINRPSRLGERS